MKVFRFRSHANQLACEQSGSWSGEFGYGGKIDEEKWFEHTKNWRFYPLDPDTFNASSPFATAGADPVFRLSAEPCDSESRLEAALRKAGQLLEITVNDVSGRYFYFRPLVYCDCAYAEPVDNHFLGIKVKPSPRELDELQVDKNAITNEIFRIEALLDVGNWYTAEGVPGLGLGLYGLLEEYLSEPPESQNSGLIFNEVFNDEIA